MATHSSILAWRIPWTAEPGKLQSMGSQRVGHNEPLTHTHIIRRAELACTDSETLRVLSDTHRKVITKHLDCS